MLLLLLAYLGGVLTIISPCILPVLPFVFARSDLPFLKSGLPLLIGMALTFAVVGTLAAVGGGWAVEANRYGRWAAIALLAFFGLTLLFPALADRLTRPLVALGSRLSQSVDDARQGGGTAAPSLLLGVATGLLWAPCAGPILGLILTGAALQGASVETSLLLLAYAAGSATSLALALLLGGRLFAAMKRSLGVSEWVRRALGLLVLIGVAAIALGLDTRLLARLSQSQTSSIEGGLSRLLGVDMDESQSSEVASGAPLPVEGRMPPLDGITTWLNSPPLTREGLRGKVVLIDFWTYSCINCIRSIPYVRAWAERYGPEGLVVIGVHAPEFAFEKDVDNVRKAMADLGIRYPVAIDNDYAVWRAFGNRYWPAHYFIDAQGRVRYHHFGEGDYAQSEGVIRTLLREAGRTPGNMPPVDVRATGAQAAAGGGSRSPETYVGYARAEEFKSPGGFALNRIRTYAYPDELGLNQWALSGQWRVGPQSGLLTGPSGGIRYHFFARDLHLVLGASGKPVRFRVLIDGKPPGDAAGVDVDANGYGTVREQRLYQLVRHPGRGRQTQFEILFEEPGVEAFAFTFG
ncbi:cytochrome c biogenesis protein DipZ [Allosphingosinicella flava]|uniref:Cytochrome c biogenesis protein DipZ n=1 Tax=Allosphingosinicella flava TaxID=2771430 RepID=A0A7T2GJF7_9SPHN|nr:cytochrome c biogenesis protein DipZ [Sphingosinicella flava]QPQ55003.1 cytochrome c biogenesis protein DipZ [Sphingosinicella flava]